MKTEANFESFSLRGHKHDETVCIKGQNYNKCWWDFAYVCLSVSAQEVDDAARVSEAVTRTVVCAMKSAPSGDNADAWLNPTEVTNTCHHEKIFEAPHNPR